MTKFQLVSDLHIDTNNLSVSDFPNIIIPSAPILVILGDTVRDPRDSLFIDLLDWVSERFERILYVSGNNEYKNVVTKKHKKTSNRKKLTIDEAEEYMVWLFDLYDNVTYLQRQSVVIGDTVFLGTTLWSYIPYKYRSFCRNRISDFYHTYTRISPLRKLTPEDTSNLYKRNTEWLKHEINKYRRSSKKICVLTHHAPLPYLHPGHGEEDWGAYAYGCNVGFLMYYVDMWCFGHIHYNINKKYDVTNCQIISNCMGYRDDNIQDYDTELVIDI